METKKCLNPKCEKEFTPKNKKGVYCSGNCRAAHAYQLKAGKSDETTLIGGLKDFIEGSVYHYVNGQLIPIDINAIKNIDFGETNETLGASKNIIPADKIETEFLILPPNPNEKRISELRNELKNPPKNPQIGLRKWIAIREYEIKKLEQNLKDN